MAQVNPFGAIALLANSINNPNYINELQQQSIMNAEKQQIGRLREEELQMRREDRARQLREQQRAEEQQRLQREYLGNIGGQMTPEQITQGLAIGINPNAIGALQGLFEPEKPQYMQVGDALLQVGANGVTPVYQAPREPSQRRIIEQGGVQYYADTGQPVIAGSVGDTVASSMSIPDTLPKLDQDPLAPFKDKDKAQIEFLKQSEQLISKEEEGIPQEQQVIDRLSRFVDLLDVQNTGAAQQPAPFIGYLDPELREMASIQAEIAPKMRQVGSGSSSDKDVELFKEATVSPTKPVQTNKNIALARIAAAQNKQDRVQFLREFQSAYGHTKGAEKEWKQYLEDNPIFDTNANPKNLQLNANRVDYRTYFQMKNSPQSGGIKFLGFE